MMKKYALGGALGRIAQKVKAGAKAGQISNARLPQVPANRSQAQMNSMAGKALMRGMAPGLPQVPANRSQAQMNSMAGKALMGSPVASQLRSMGVGGGQIPTQSSTQQRVLGGGQTEPFRQAARQAAATTMKKGGSVKSSASKRADGIASKGKTRGKVI